jgi:hypothetical protein
MQEKEFRKLIGLTMWRPAKDIGVPRRLAITLPASEPSPPIPTSGVPVLGSLRTMLAARKGQRRHRDYRESHGPGALARCPLSAARYRCGGFLWGLQKMRGVAAFSGLGGAATCQG